MSVSNTISFEQICRHIEQGKFAPIYLLMGDESYFIETITNRILEKAITPEAKDFDQTIVYGLDTDVHTLIALLRQYPMMSTHQLVVLKEAQDLKQIELLESYCQNALPSTILVINYKYGILDKRKKLYNAILKSGGVIFESNKLYDNKIPPFISSYVASFGLKIGAKSTQMLTDYLGNDLKKIVNELDKLQLAIGPNTKEITPDLIEQHIGISKNYNNFELLRALIARDESKVMQIAHHFQKSPKNNPYVVTLTVLFNYFSNLLVCYWATDKSPSGLANELGLKNQYQAREYAEGVKNYTAFKCMNIISLIRTYDAKGKGFENPSTPVGELLKELLYKIMH